MTKLFEPSDDSSRNKPTARLVRPPRNPAPADGRLAQRQGDPEEGAPAEPRRSASAPDRDAPEHATVALVEDEDWVGSASEQGAETLPVAPPSEAEAGTPTGRPARRPLPHVSVRTLVIVLAGIAMVVWLGQGLVGIGGNSGALNTTDPADGARQQDTTGTTPRPSPRPKPVVIDGTQIRPPGTILTLNPALAQPGASVGVSAVGFDAGASIDLTLSVKGVQGTTSLGTFKVDRQGALNAQITMPQRLTGGTAVVTARQRNSDKVAKAEAAGASGIGFVKLGKGQETGEPGDVLTLSARGFSPGEKIKVYWGRASGPPATTLTADGSGGVGEASVRVGTGAVGDATIVLVGAESGTTATAPFHVLGLYPTVNASPFAVKAKEDLAISGSGFAPEERVLVYINASSGTPLTTGTADAQGSLGGVAFEVPYGLRGSQSLVLVGELSRASVSSGFEILPYTPSAQPSTYGGSPGTTFSFYATGFGPDEVVEVYLGRGQGNTGELVTAFRVDEQGDANAAGSYMVRGDQQGKLSFTLVGRQSRSQTSATFSATPASGPVDLPEPPPYTLPPHLTVDEPPSGEAPGRAEQAPRSERRAR